MVARKLEKKYTLGGKIKVILKLTPVQFRTIYQREKSIALSENATRYSNYSGKIKSFNPNENNSDTEIYVTWTMHVLMHTMVIVA